LRFALKNITAGSGMIKNCAVHAKKRRILINSCIRTTQTAACFIEAKPANNNNGMKFNEFDNDGRELLPVTDSNNEH